MQAVTWKAAGQQAAAFQFSRWAYVLYAAMFFAFFGFTAGAKKNYRLVINFFASRHDNKIVPGITENRYKHSESATYHMSLSSTFNTQTPDNSYLQNPYLLQRPSSVCTDNPHRASHDSCPLELSAQVYHTSCLAGNVREAGHMPSTPSVPASPAPVLDIILVLRRDSTPLDRVHAGGQVVQDNGIDGEMAAQDNGSKLDKLEGRGVFSCANRSYIDQLTGS
ncbi:hypothetical protein SERLADRAFT_436335 [Serpula lacrymans var. lacrymans S7.9]|nr:uncharacterized protein SERLADRAFT_436335 [Serpula lacrymans var. lacrymans S7.9]EGO26515.1 hypothetical protein SERLADRAFT_436335 [Serpula lacrymans var. lacrymans S7.9]